MGFGFSILTAVFPLFFLVMMGFFVVVMIRSLAEWRNNNHSPRLTVPAKVVAKRLNRTHHTNGMHHTSTTYYATFEFESGDRLELHLAGNEYGLLAEGDFGKLKFQGTRFLGFERIS